MSQPKSASRASTSSVSTPSATAASPRLCARSMTLRTTSALPASVVMVSTNERSTLTSVTGSEVSCARLV